MLIPSVGGIKFFKFEQSTPSTTWTIFHGFGHKPLVDVNAYDGGVLKKAFPVSIIHVDDDNVTITWSTPRSGFASLASTQI